MAHSIEIRVPFVDPVFLANALASMGAPGKRDLAATPVPPLPPELADRPKTSADTAARYQRWVYGDKIAKVALSKLTERQVKEWRTNLSLGGRPEAVTPTAAVVDLARRAAAAVGVVAEPLSHPIYQLTEPLPRSRVSKDKTSKRRSSSSSSSSSRARHKK
jgi:hypothetical protein